MSMLLLLNDTEIVKLHDFGSESDVNVSKLKNNLKLKLKKNLMYFFKINI